MMFKRNEGYALSYVLVVLLVLCIIAISVMSAPLRNLQMQQASIARMQDKYAAQGMIEQVVAQLEHAESELDIFTLKGEAGNPDIGNNNDEDDSTYAITAISDSCVVTAVIKLTPILDEPPPVQDGTVDPQSPDDSDDSDQPVIIGYTVTYESYNISYNTGGGA